MKVKCPHCKKETKLDSVMYNVGLCFYTNQKCEHCKGCFTIESKNFKLKKRG